MLAVECLGIEDATKKDQQRGPRDTASAKNSLNKLGICRDSQAFDLMIHAVENSDPLGGAERGAQQSVSVYTAIGNGRMNHRSWPSGLVDPHVGDLNPRMRGPMRHQQPARKQTEAGRHK
jgi:hypothetical protein